MDPHVFWDKRTPSTILLKRTKINANNLRILLAIKLKGLKAICHVIITEHTIDPYQWEWYEVFMCITIVYGFLTYKNVECNNSRITRILKATDGQYRNSLFILLQCFYSFYLIVFQRFYCD